MFNICRNFRGTRSVKKREVLPFLTRTATKFVTLISMFCEPIVNKQ